MKKIPDLNCDLGEHESASATSSLMRLVTSANIACGGHAGDLKSMQRCLRLAKKYGVRAGAHPGIPDRAGFGRTVQRISPRELEVLLCSQISCLETLARKEKIPLRHVKLHGALYHMVERDPRLGKAYLDCVSAFWPGFAVRSIAGGRITRLAKARGLPVSPELFADRAYADPVTLVPRTEAGAVLSGASPVIARLRTFLREGTWPLRDGRTFRPEAATLCFHGDTPGAANLLQRLRKSLR